MAYSGRPYHRVTLYPAHESATNVCKTLVTLVTDKTVAGSYINGSTQDINK
jgi:hypothetical protein